MKMTYETYTELAEAMTKGEGILHASNCAQHVGFTDPCMAWQWGVLSFAQWLDHLGCKVEVTDKAEDFYHFMALKQQPSREGPAH